MEVATGALIGREAELAVVRGALDGAPGGARALVLQGDAGIGKTTLWDAALAEAGRRGHTVLRASGAQSEVQLLLGAVGDLFDGLHDVVLPELPPPQRRALAVALLLEENDREPEPRLLDVAFLGALRVLAARRPVVVAIDDVQWLDATTMGLLTFAVRRLRDERVLFLLARRADASSAPTELERASGARLQRVEVGPLTLGAIAALLHERVDLTLPRPVLVKLYETSGGNPFFALELARALQHDEAPASELRVPNSLRTLVRERLGRLPEETRAALLVVAAGGVPAEVVDPRALDPAAEAGVVALSGDRIRFTHPLLAASLVEDAAPAELRTVHELLAATATDPEQRARHRAAAATGPDESVAAALEDAARAAHARGATAAAAELLERALSLTPAVDVRARARRGGEAGRLCAAVGDGLRGGALMRQAIDLIPSGHERATAIWLLLDSATQTGDNPVALGEEALRFACEDGDLRARIHSALSEVQLVRGEIAAALGHAREARACAQDDLLRVVALGRAANLETLCAVGDPDAGLAEAIDLESRLVGAHTHAVNSPRNHLGRRLFWRDELDRARTLFSELRAEAIATYADDARPNVCLYLARIELRAGNRDLARAYADEAFDLAEPAGYTQVIGGALSVRGLVAAWSGDLDAARRLIGESAAVAASVADRWHGLHNRVSTGLLAASVCAWGEVLDATGTLAAELDELGVHEPSVFPFEGDALEALVATGRLEEARALVERQAAHDRPRTQAVAARGRALLLGAEGAADAAAAAFEAALPLHDAFGDPLERARTQLLLGAALRRARRRRDARDVLEAALATFERIGSTAFAARARDELERLSGRRAAGGLTATEERVAALVAQGLSNKQVAAELVVTVKSIEAHLTRIYAKQGVRSRAELMRALTS